MPDDDLDNLTPDELRERVRSLEAAESMYGGNSVAPGGGEGGPGARGRARESSDDAAFLKDVASRFNSKTGRHQAMQPVSTAELDRYVKIVAGAHVARHLGENSSSPVVRAALNPERLRRAQEGR
jgi:hypothetical protein